jgi:hypothetical protein
VTQAPKEKIPANCVRATFDQRNAAETSHRVNASPKLFKFLVADRNRLREHPQFFLLAGANFDRR